MINLFTFESNHGIWACSNNSLCLCVDSQFFINLTMIKPTLQSHNIKDIELVLYAGKVIKKMDENVSIFTAPSPRLEQLKDLVTQFQKAMAAAAFRDRRAVAFRNEKKAELLNQMRLLSYYVAQIAKGDRSIILASGFVPSKVKGTKAKNFKPTMFKVTPKIGSGGVKLHTNAWRHAHMYRYEYRKIGQNENWEVVLSSKSRCEILGLEVFQEYEFRVSYVLKVDELIYSDSVCSMVY